ncbi:MAG: hypothetical protein DRI98_03605 [Bacteroidetes bacterium]|nr:MAG: hypothetical protein DRI98_03605 [Bacteroidota bacterium]
MKGMKAYIYSILAIILCLAMGMDGYGQGKKLEKTYRWIYQVNEDVNFAFENYDCNLTIHTWDKPEIEYVMTVDATLKSEEDARRLDEYIMDLKFSNSTSSVHIDNRFWTSKKAIMGRKTMTLKGARTIRFSEFKMKGEMWIPENSNLNLTSKYSEIEVGDLNGRVSIDLYNDKLYGGLVNSNIKIAAKYSTLEFTDMKDINADIYNTTVEAGDIGSLSIVSKYSKFKVGNAGKVDVDAYNDKYTFGTTGDIRFIDKYSDLRAEQTGHTELDCYNSTVIISRVEDVDLISKYGTYEFKEARNLNIATAYTDKYSVDSLGTLNIADSKYGVFKIAHLERSLLLNEGYSDKVFVTKTGNLKEVKVNGKYVVLEMALDKDYSYRFKANVKYPEFDINEESMNVRKKIKESSELEMEAIKGTESEGMPSFFVNGYDMAITLTER